MRRILRQVFHVEPEDHGRVLAFMLLGGLLQAGLAIGISAADSLFLAKVGADQLPVIYICTPLLMMLYIPAYSHLLGRHGVARVFNFTLALLVTGGAAAFLALHFLPGAPSYYAAKFWTALWYVGLYTLFWNFVDGYFDLTKAKRLFGLLASGAATGAIAGGSIVNFLAEDLGVPALFLMWSGFAICAWPVLRFIRQRYRPIAAAESGEETKPIALSETLRRIVGTRFVFVLVLVLFLTLVTATICEYQYLHVFTDATNETSLAELFGRLVAGVNVFNLVISLFVFHPLVMRFGVRNIALIQPIAFLVVFALFLFQGGLGAALLGFLAFQGIMTSIDFNNVNLLFNGMPEDGKSQVRTFVEGLCEPLATATAGVFLIFFGQRLGPANLSGIGFLCALVLLALVFALRADYVAAMIVNIRRSWLDFDAVWSTRATRLSVADEELLEQHAAAGDVRARLSALGLLWLNFPRVALTRMLDFLPHANAAERRAVQPLAAAMLATRDPELQLLCFKWAEQHAARLDATLLEELGRQRLAPPEAGLVHLQHDDATARAAGAALLWRSPRLGHSRRALAAVDELIQSAQPALAGIYGLGRLGEPRFAPNLVGHLQSSDPAVRRAALLALRELAGRESTPLVRPLLALLAAYHSAEEREAALDLLGRIADPASIEPLLALSGRFTPHERRMTVNLLIAFGPLAVPTLVRVVENLDFPLFGRSIGLRTLGTIALPQLQQLAPALIDRLVARAYAVTGWLAALEAEPVRGPGVAMLSFVYRDLPRFVLELVFEVLSVSGRLPGHESIITALQSGNARERSYAIENLEEGCGRRLFARILPFLEQRTPAAIHAFGRARRYVDECTTASAIDRSLKVRFALESATALQALHETRPTLASRAAMELLLGQPAPLLRETALALLAREKGAVVTTPIERIQSIARTEFFSDWGVRQLEFVTRDLEERQLAPGAVLFRAGEDAGGAHVLLSGHVRAGTREFSAGEIVGAEALLGTPHRGVTATASGRVTTLFISRDAVHACARVYASVGIDLLRRQRAAA